MKFISFFFLICLFNTLDVFGQKKQFIYFIQFKDKPSENVSENQSLSTKSIERRKKLHIPFDDNDKQLNLKYIQTIESMQGIIWQKSRWLNGVLARFSHENMKDSLLQLPFVSNVTYMQTFYEPIVHNESIEENNIYKPQINTLKEQYGQSYRWIETLQATNLVSQNYLGKNINIAIIDAGFLHVNKHHSFKHTSIMHTYDFVTNETNVYNDDSHGSEVLSCLAAVDSGNIIGMAPKANYILLRTEDALHEMLYEEILWAVAAEYADSIGADIINSSLGYNIFDKGESHDYREFDGKTTYIAKATSIAASKGIWVFISAGNEGNDPWHFITTPADAYGITTVGACNFEGKETYFTSSGPTADGRMSPIISAPGLYIYTINTSGNNLYHYKSGSSYSTPIICGLAADLMQKFPQASIETLKTKLYKSCNHYPDTDNYIGYGMPKFDLIDTTNTDFNFCILKLTCNKINSNDIEVKYSLCEEMNFTIKIYIKKHKDWKQIRRKKIKYKAIEGSLIIKKLKIDKLYKICLTQNNQKVYTESSR